MDEDDSLPPPPPPPPPFPENNTNNNIHNIPYSLFTPSLPQSQHTLPQNSQFGLDNDNIDWVSLLSGTGSITNGGGSNQMPPAASHVSLASRSTININGEGDESRWKNKRKAGGTKKPVPPRVAFHTRSSEDTLDDGYKWRKYGQKAVKNSKHPRSYYRCTHHTCNVKKQIQRLSKDKSVVVTTYEGIHNHPCEKLMETLTPLLRQLQFLSRF